jgi:flagellar basal body-associated protein FliL
MHTSKRGAIIIAICCAIIVASYFFYKKQHAASQTQSQRETPMIVHIGIGTTTIDAVMQPPVKQ